MKSDLETVLYKCSITGIIFMIPVALFYHYIWKPYIDLPCVMDFFFGIYCPGCGGTRAVKALLGGKVFLSLWYHPLVLYFAIIWGGFMITHTLERCGIKKIKGWKFHNWYLYGAVIILAVNCIGKNILRICFQICM